MASRKKDPAVLRTLSIFSGKTPLEEANVELEEAADVALEQRSGHPLEMVHAAEETAIRWLGLDAFHDHGDDVKVAVHKDGHAVLVLIRATGQGLPYGTANIKLSKTQWNKLRQLAKEA